MRWLTIFLAACLAAGAGYYYWLQQAEAKLDIQTVAATRADVRRAVSTSGTVRALGVSSTTRVAALPDVPPIAENGVPGFDAVAWLMLVAPAGTPKPIVEKLHDDLGV